VQWVFSVEYIFYQLEQYVADFCLYITAIRWAVPDDPSLSYGFDANLSDECTSFLCRKLLVINVIILIKSRFISSNVYALD